MRADFDWHAAGNAAASLMDVHDAALSHELSAAIEDTPYQRAARLTASMLASGHMRLLRGPIKSLRAVLPYRLPRLGGSPSLLWGMRFDRPLLELKQGVSRTALIRDTKARDMRVGVVISALALTAFSACGTLSPSERLPQVSDSGRVEPMGAQSAVQSLQRQVRERDRRIAELTFQLEALKTIDREAEARRHQGRFPGTRDR
jgi:hypothetical protein